MARAERAHCATCGKCDEWCTDQDSTMALWATQNPGWPETCAAVPTDVEDWKDEWGFSCADWAEDCNVARMNTEADCVKALGMTSSNYNTIKTTENKTDFPAGCYESKHSIPMYVGIFFK